METVALVLAALALFLTYGKQKQIDALKQRLQNLEQVTDVRPPASVPRAQAARSQPAMEEPTTQPEAAVAIPTNQAASLESDQSVGPTGAWRPLGEEPPPQPQPQNRSAPASFDMEKAMGVHLPVWGGALMLLVAGFFLARMAADNGFFTPTLGVVACAIGAVLMLAAAVLVRQLRITNHAQIAAALASAAIGTLYATSFLSSAAFGLTSLFTGFLLSAGTAALALGIALAFGRPVLVVGLLGGYLAPFFLLADAPGEIVFHLYLAALLVAGTATCARQGWWNLLTPMILPHFSWLAGFAVLGTPFGSPSIPTITSLVVTPLAIFVLSERRGDVLQANPAATHLSTALAMLLIVGGSAWTSFDPLYLTGFCVLAVGTGVMTLLGRSGSFYPTYMTAIAWLVLVALWRQPDETTRLAVVVLALLAIAAPLIAGLLKGRQAPRLSAILCVVAAATFVSTMVDLDDWGGVRDLPYLWAALALAFAAAAVLGGMIFGRSAPPEAGDTVRGIFGASASAYVSLAIVAVVDADYFALAAALQVLGLSLVYHRYPVAHLVRVAGAYATMYFAVLAISAVTPIGYASWGAISPYLPSTAPWDAPVVALLLPALAFLAAATILTRSADWPLTKVLDGAGVLLTALAVSYLILPDLGDLRLEDTLVWSSLWGNAITLIGLAALVAGEHLGRRGLAASGLVVALGTLGATVLAAVVPVYQFWPVWNVPGLPLLNASITGLAIPGALALAVAWSLRNAPAEVQLLRWGAAVAGGLLVLSGILVDIRHLFHPDLLQGLSGPIERYTYSAGMLAMAFTALLFGTRLDSQPLRYGSLVIMLATVAKVFLFDIGGLEGIWRVASFVAMGVALLATSWFYGRYVFGRLRPQAGQGQTAEQTEA